MTSQTPREAFRHGSDCAVAFVRRADTDRAWIDVWNITANGETYEFHMMQMNHANGSPVFGSFYKDGRRVWTFRDDPRAQAGFKGGSYTFVYHDKTYVLFENRFGVQHVLPFVAFLHNPWSVTEVTGSLRQDILQAYSVRGLTTPEAPKIDPRRLAALRSAQAREQAERQQTVVAGRRRAFPEVPVAPDERHLQFFNEVLAYMAVPKQSE